MKNNIRRKLIVFSILISMFSSLFSGCYDKSELDEIALVVGMGIDKIPDNNSFTVTLEIANPKRSNNRGDETVRETSSIIKVSTGKTIFDAVQNFSKTSSVIMDFSHIKVIIISKELCELGIQQVLDYVGRDSQLSGTNWIFVANKTAQEVLKSKISNEDITSLGLANMMNKLKKKAFILPVTLNNFIIGSENQSKSSFAPVVNAEKSKDNSQGEIKIEKTAIFKNNHLVGVLSTEESRNLLWLLDKAKGTTVIFPLKPTDSNENISVEVSKASTKIIPFITKEEVHFQIQCAADAEIKEIDNIDLNSEIISKLESNIENILKSQLTELIDKSQKDLNTDFIGFSETIYNNDPQTWLHMKADWDKIYPNIKYNINFKITLSKVGLIKNSPTKNNMEEKLK